jgi:hypothetical protein
VILRPPMRRLLAFAILSALALGCGGGPCQDLGEKLCGCVSSGTTKDACVRGVKDEISRQNPGGDVDSFCQEKVDACHAPASAQFCDWIDTRCGKASCGLSVEDAADPIVCEQPAP